jgi:hypothetical protein
MKWLAMWMKVLWWRIRQKLRHWGVLAPSLETVEAQQREEVGFLCYVGDDEALSRAVRVFESWRDTAKSDREKLHALWLLGMLNDEFRRRGAK